MRIPWASHRFVRIAQPTKMMKSFFCVSLKTGSLVLAVFNFASGIAGLIFWCYKLQNADNEDDKLFHWIALSLSVANAVRGVILVVAIVKGSHQGVLVWLSIAFLDLSVMVMFTGVHMFEYKPYIVGFVLSLVFWYCWIAVLNFYQELRIYNLGEKAVLNDSRIITVPETAQYSQQVLF